MHVSSRNRHISFASRYVSAVKQASFGSSMPCCDFTLRGEKGKKSDRAKS
jgi:hypothetical protein